jgi:hypothetical protein
MCVALEEPSSQHLYTAAPFLHGALRSLSDHEAMDLIAIALALGVFAVLVLLIEGIERV